MTTVTVITPPLVQGAMPGNHAHHGAKEFAAVEVERVGSVLEVYGANGEQVAAYAPGRWASAVLT